MFLVFAIMALSIATPEEVIIVFIVFGGILLAFGVYYIRELLSSFKRRKR